ncbi:MAG: proline dehydrogenase family protein [Planctomycetota bacterium]|jgi:proline dehydrogenase
MLSRIVPAPLVRWFARPYVAGDSIQAALGTAQSLQDANNLRTTLDLLGEGVTRQDQVEKNVGVYERLIDALAAAERLDHASVSLKPSAFTTGEPEDVRAPLTALAERAHERGVPLTIDMEERRWTDLTLDLSIGLFERGFDVGTVLQSRLFRTEQDLERVPAGMRVRLVIGIYPEPAEFAFTHKRDMKEAMLTQAKRLLERGAFVEFATHAEDFIERFVRDVAPSAPERCEVQMLLGVPRGSCHRQVLDGSWGTPLPVRIYVPFAIGWHEATAYLRRRMEESPSMIWLVLRNFLRAGRDR